MQNVLPNVPLSGEQVSKNRHLHINSICINSLALQQSSDNIIKDSRFSVKCYNALGSFI